MQKSPKVAALAVMVKATHHQRGAGCSTTPEMRSVNQLKLRLFKTSGTRWTEAAASPLITSGAVGAASMFKLPIAKSDSPPRIEHRQSQTSTIGNRRSKIENSSCWFLLETCDADVFCVRHFRIWIANAGEITGSRVHVQIFEETIIAVLLFHFRNAAFRILDVAKNNCFRGAGLRACCRKRIAGDKRIG